MIYDWWKLEILGMLDFSFNTEYFGSSRVPTVYSLYTYQRKNSKVLDGSFSFQGVLVQSTVAF